MQLLRKALIIVLGVSPFIFGLAEACLGLMFETRTFLHTLPEKAFERDLVAKIKILQTTTESSRRISKVVVIDPLKGTTKGSVFEVLSEIHDCARDSNVKSGKFYFLSGEIKKSGNFEGLWKLEDFDHSEKSFYMWVGL